ncbi:Hypothetical protein SRAE_0000008400 [Strongyloides ratti]|uniref:Ovule protein n=1 Tax=Strongyloides ratti TaxID=34506 RepID=A0A090KYJ3_STRRB|nr:Hypothetical protein SRAE_0000008400 [Strongyloides ratti]CEF60952.1 Hypothetical protein SRAE_0000008400 [Strongyloides ratti]
MRPSTPINVPLKAGSLKSLNTKNQKTKNFGIQVLSKIKDKNAFITKIKTNCPIYIQPIHSSIYKANHPSNISTKSTYEKNVLKIPSSKSRNYYLSNKSSHNF